MQYSFLENPTAEHIHQILALYTFEGWWVESRDDLDLVQRIITGSHCFLIGEEGGRLVGMGRAISDRASDAYIQDVAVDVAYRGQGIGREIVRRLLERLNKDGVNWVGLIAERGSHPFYERLGFGIMQDATPMVRIQSYREQNPRSPENGEQSHRTPEPQRMEPQKNQSGVWRKE